MSVPGRRQGLSFSGKSSSIFTCVIGLPADSYIGLASTSIFEVATAGKSAPETGIVPLEDDSFLAAGFTATSLDAVR
jgi:hypothetical protein